MSVPVPGPTGPSDEFRRSSAPSASSSRCDEDDVDEEDLVSAAGFAPPVAPEDGVGFVAAASVLAYVPILSLW